MDIQEFIAKFKYQLENEKLEVTPDTDYVNSEFWDSLTNMAVNVMLEDDYHINLTPEELNKFSSIRELFEFVQKHQK